MKTKRKPHKLLSWIWPSYAILISCFFIRNAHYFLGEGSEVRLYFYILYAFDSAYVIDYLINFTQIIINLICCIPLFCYVFRIRFLTPETWQVFLILRLIFDIIGNSYYLNQLVALYHASPKLAYTVFISSILNYLPSYIACFRYAFQFDKVFPPKSEDKTPTKI